MSKPAGTQSGSGYNPFDWGGAAFSQDEAQSIIHRWIWGSSSSEEQSLFAFDIDLADIRDYILGVEEWVKGKAEEYRNWLYACYEEQGITVVRTNEWSNYLAGTYNAASSKSWGQRLNPFTYGSFDTELMGQNLYHNQSWAKTMFYVEPLSTFAYGWQINYTGQGMLNAAFKIPQVNLITPFVWKTGSAVFTDGWGGKYRLKHAFDSEMYKFTFAGYDYYRQRSVNEK